ncbi:MAG: thiamine phosphate synthase [Pseudomonadota bacterium]
MITPQGYEKDLGFAEKLSAVLGAGDVASLLITPAPGHDYQALATPLVKVAQEHGVAALLCEDSRIMGRTGADGLHLEGAIEDIVETVKAHAGREIMGVGDLGSRHDAMMMGEGPVDYLFFGRLDGDRQPGIFKKSFALAEWWSSLFEVPAVVMGGTSVESVREAADAAIDFVALRNAIFEASDPQDAIRAANAYLDQSYELKRADLENA